MRGQGRGGCSCLTPAQPRARPAVTVPSLPRYSVSVFQPPFQLGRMSPEQGLQPLLPDKPEPLAKSSCTAATSAPELGDEDRASGLLQEPPLSPAVPELHPELGDSSTVRSKVLPARSSLLSLDSGFSEHVESQGDSCCEKEPSYERALKPEGKRCRSANPLCARSPDGPWERQGAILLPCCGGRPPHLCSPRGLVRRPLQASWRPWEPCFGGAAPPGMPASPRSALPWQSPCGTAKP